MREKKLWKSRLLSFAYSYQGEAQSYRQLLETTKRNLNPSAGERWLDLGCGTGRLIKVIWEKSDGRAQQVVGVDISYLSLRYAQESFKKFNPAPSPGRIEIIQADFSGTLLRLFRPNTFDGITAGLSLCYAEHWDAARKRWDNKTYFQLLNDIFLLLKPGGSFVFSSCVPDPDFWRVARGSWRQVFLTRNALTHLLAGSIMLLHAWWVASCARKGRYHFPSADDVIARLQGVGFSRIKCELTYADQAWVFHATKQTSS